MLKIKWQSFYKASAYFYNNMQSEEKFKLEMECVFQTYMSKMPKAEETFASAIARITWLKESVQQINVEVAPLIDQYAAGDDALSKKLKALVVLRTKDLTAAFKK